MKYAIAVNDKERQEHTKYKKENALLKQELSALKKILGKVSNLVQHFSAVQLLAQSRNNHLKRKKRALPSKRLHRRLHRFQADFNRYLRKHSLSSSQLKIGSSHISLKSLIPSDISTVQNINDSTMNSSFATCNLSNENEVSIDSNVMNLFGWITPSGSESGSPVYFTAKNSSRSSEGELEFFDADVQQDDGYDADVEMSRVLLHGDVTVNGSNAHNENQSSPLLLLQSQSVPVFTDFSFQSANYVTQQSSDVFSNYNDILSNETNNNYVPLDTHHSKNQQQNTVASVNVSVAHNDIGSKSPVQVPQFVSSSVQQHSEGYSANDVEMATQNAEQCQNASEQTSIDDFIAMIERSHFEYVTESNQSDELHLQNDEQLVQATNADVTENMPFLYPQYPNTFGSFLNTSSVFNYRSPQTNEIHNADAPTIFIIGTHNQSIDDCAALTSMGGHGVIQQSVSYIDDSMGGDLLELAKDLSSSSSMFEESNVSTETSYENVFNTSYMVQSAAYFAQETACEFSIAEFLSPDLIESEQRVNRCSCCLCQLREKNGCPLDVCIRKHPNMARCQQLRTNTAVCSACMESMTLISPKTKTKQYRCIDGSCTGVFKTSKSLRSHYLKHLKCKMFFCSFCEKAFNTVGGLKSHERSHAKK